MISCIITSRLSSRRLPEKALRLLQGKPMLGHVCDRIGQCNNVDRIIVATSIEKEDDAIEGYCFSNGISVFRGSLNDVSARLRDCLNVNPVDAFVRISGDSPLIDPNLVDKLISYYYKKDSDLVTNVLKRSYPKGQSVEVIKSSIYLKAQKRFVTAYDKEHVTPFFYANSDKFKIHNIVTCPDYSDVQMSVDNKIDFLNIDAALGELGNIFDWRQALAKVLDENEKC